MHYRNGALKLRNKCRKTLSYGLLSDLYSLLNGSYGSLALRFPGPQTVLSFAAAIEIKHKNVLYEVPHHGPVTADRSLFKP